MLLQSKTPIITSVVKIIFIQIQSRNITNFIDEAIAELEKNPNKVNELTEISLIQSLLKKERHHAFLTTFDMLLAGIDTVWFFFVTS